MEHALQFTAVEKDGKKVVHLRSYKIILKKSGTRIPRIELEEMGPRMDLVLRRTHLASDDLFSTACKQVKVRLIIVQGRWKWVRRVRNCAPSFLIIGNFLKLSEKKNF